MTSGIAPARRSSVVVLVLIASLLVPTAALAHARVSPAVSLAGQLQLYSLAVPTEKANLTTSRVVMTVPSGFGIDSFVPPPAGWTQHVQQTGSADNAVIQKVTWTGGKTPTGQDSLFEFLAQPASTASYTFQVQQTYSDGSIVDWSGPESSADPSPTIRATETLGGGGTSALTIVALVVGVLGLAAGGYALAGNPRAGRRPLA